MYETSVGIRALFGAEAQLFASAAWTLTDHLRNLISSGDNLSYDISPHDASTHDLTPHDLSAYDASTHDHLLGNPVLDSLTAQQVVVLLDRVTGYLLDPSVPAPARTAVLDATIASVFQQIYKEVQAEVEQQLLLAESAELAAQTAEGDTFMRIRVAAACCQALQLRSGAMHAPDPECAVMETWESVIEGLCDRILPDSDWQLEAVMLDLDPSTGAELKGAMGIQDDYFIDIAAEASVDEAATAWCNLVERVTGWRPEQWRFTGPIPADAKLPPVRDVLIFPEPSYDPQLRPQAAAAGQQTQLVLLSDVVFEVDGMPDEWSAFLNRNTGEVLSLPTSLISFIEDGGQVDGHIEEQEEELRLAQRICSSGEFLRLPGKPEIHEWSIMRQFCDTVESDSDHRELLDAVHGTGAFRFFNAAAKRLGLLARWYDYRDAAIEQIIIEWLDAHGILWSRGEPGAPPF